MPSLVYAVESCVEEVGAQLRSIHMFADAAPIILAGTRKDEVKGSLSTLSERFLAELKRRCGPAIDGLVPNKSDGGASLSFFAIENSRGYSGDASIRELVKAIEGAALALPTMQQRMPVAWLRVIAELRRIGQTQRKVTRSVRSQ